MLSGWSRVTVLVGVFGACGLLVLAVASGDSVLTGGVAAVLVLGLAVYAALPRIKEGDPQAASLAPGARPALPDSAGALLEALDGPIMVLDISGRVRFSNSASRALLGQDAERKHISAVLRTPEVLESVARVLAGGTAESVDFSVQVPLQRHYRAFIVPVGGDSVGGDNETSARFLLQFHDLTAMRRAEEMRADFVANASHELRTPLAAVSGFIDTLRGHAKNDADARERFLEIMSVEAGRMRRLIDDLLSLARIELNEHVPPSGEVDLVAILRDAAAALSSLADADGIDLDIGDCGPIMVVGDRDQLIQIFQNLIHNAIKYGREKSAVRIRFGTSVADGQSIPARVFASVEDQGEGIPREAIPRLTERFYRVDVKRSRERGGTGLGLAIVKHILNRHHGQLQIESSPGVGSVFTVFLPAAKGQGARTEGQETALPDRPERSESARTAS